jgi:hypothetical protein
MCDDNCCTTTADGQAICDVTAAKEDAIQGRLSDNGESTTRRRKIRSGFLLGVGCLTSPCCTPLLVPLTITLLAGTPLAAFLAQYVGWVYAVLTLVSLVSLFLGVRHVWPDIFAQPQKAAGSALDHLSAEESQGVSAEMKT